MKRERWDLDHFRESGHLPEVVAEIGVPFVFSSRNMYPDRHGIDWTQEHPIRVLDLCLKVPGGPWEIPWSLRQFMPTIFEAATFEHSISPIEYVYITVDQKAVIPGVTQRRPGWHSDAFVVDSNGRQCDLTAETGIEASGYVERTYIAYDALPTLFADGPWTVPGSGDDCELVLATWDAEAERKPVRTYAPYTLLVLDPYCVHAAASNPHPETVNRTFVKIQFSGQRYNREGNTLNPRIDYSDWVWVPRDPERREHRYA